MNKIILSSRNAISANVDRSLENQRERFMALNSKGLEGLVPRAKLLLSLGGTFFLGFGPLILITIAFFLALYLKHESWVVGGIGKTTLAKVFYMKIRCKFEISCTLDNVREISGQRHGLLKLQRELCSKLKIMDTEIEDVCQGIDTIRNFLFNKKVLLVIDDVSDISQLENLAKKEWTKNYSDCKRHATFDISLNIR